MKGCIIIAILYILLILYLPKKFILYDSIQKLLIILLLLWLGIYKHQVFYIPVITCMIIFSNHFKPLSVVYYLIRLYYDDTYYHHLGYNLFRDLGYPIMHNFNKLPHKPSILLLNYPSDMFEYFLNGVIPLKTCFVVSKKVKFCMNFIHQDELIFSNMRKKIIYLIFQTVLNIR